MKNSFLNKRIPSLLALLFLALSVGMISWFGRTYTELRSKASGGETPTNMMISNISDTSFTISYTTSNKVIGAISYGPDLKLGQVGLDDRDKNTGKTSIRQVHYMTISRLNPGTKYYFTIQSGEKNFLNNNLPFEVTTSPSLQPRAGLEQGNASASADLSNDTSVTGNILFLDGTLPTEGIVYLSTDDSQLLSALIKNDGTYFLDINSLRSANLTRYAVVGDDTILRIIIQNSTDISRVAVRASNAASIPPVTLSKDYDFTIDTSFADFTASGSAPLVEASPSATLSPGAKTPGFPSFPSVGASGPAILAPKAEEKFIDQQPLFHGTAAPNAIVVISIESTENIQTSVKADEFGTWQFRPGSPLSPGEHVITIRSLDVSGIERTIKRQFTVFAEGSQFTEPSVSPANPTPTASATPTLVPTRPITITPTTIPAPTITPTPTLVITITPTPKSAPATPTITPRPTSLPIAPPGNSSLFLGGVLAVLSITAGFMLFFF